jgi:hypothetical protein
MHSTVANMKQSAFSAKFAVNDDWRPVFGEAGTIRYYSLARHALLQALIALEAKRGEIVLLPEYLCRDLLAPLYLLGLKACWYPIAPDMTPSTPPEDWPKATIVLAVNYFGFPQDLGPFRAYVDRTGATIIEDNAHGYLSRGEDGQWLGCRTGIGIFSMRKTLRIPDGAALWVESSKLASKLQVQIPFEGDGVIKSQELKAKMRKAPIVGETIYRTTILAARMLRKYRTGIEVPMSDPVSEIEIPALATPWRNLLSVLESNQDEIEIIRRRNAYAQFASFGEQIGIEPIFKQLPNKCAPYGYAFRANDKAKAEVRRLAIISGFDLMGWPDLPDEIAKTAPKHYLDLNLINFLW